jgi:hypothetical protein
LASKSGLAPRGEAEFAAQIVDGLGPLAADEAGQALDGAAHAGDGLSARARRGYMGRTGGSKAEKKESGART